MPEQKWILGIDFGTSYTVAAGRVIGGRTEVIEMGGERRIPSVILVEPNGTILTGRIADELSSANPESTLRAPKSRLGDVVPAILNGKPYQVVELVGEMLRAIYVEAVRHHGAPPEEVRLTHPATWNLPMRNRLCEAAAKAGLSSPFLVPEPVAAALSYAADVGVATGGHVAVYDLGGGTFDTAVVRSTGEGFEVVGRPTGDSSIGGELFDELLMHHVGARLDPQSWERIQVGADWSAQRLSAGLRAEVRRAKETLSSHVYADVVLSLPSGVVQHRVMRDEFEELIRPYVDETVTLLRRCIDNSGLSVSDLVAVHLVGGASRSPLVERLTAAAFPSTVVSRRGDPKTAVALGATRAPRSASSVVAPAPPTLSPTPSAADTSRLAPAAAAPTELPGHDQRPPAQPTQPTRPADLHGTVVHPTNLNAVTRRSPWRTLVGAFGPALVLVAGVLLSFATRMPWVDSKSGFEKHQSFPAVDAPAWLLAGFALATCALTAWLTGAQRMFGLAGAAITLFAFAKVTSSADAARAVGEGTRYGINVGLIAVALAGLGSIWMTVRGGRSARPVVRPSEPKTLSFGGASMLAGGGFLLVAGAYQHWRATADGFSSFDNFTLIIPGFAWVVAGAMLVPLAVASVFSPRRLEVAVATIAGNIFAIWHVVTSFSSEVGPVGPGLYLGVVGVGLTGAGALLVTALELRQRVS